MLDRSAIAAMIPHGGAMCLLDQVTTWDATRICCRSGTHRNTDNPLREDGRLHAACGIEYAAQAMAVHGGLTADTGRSRAGFLISLRDVTCARGALDVLAGDLTVDVERMAADSNTVLYAFRVAVGGVEMVAGRAVVRLDVDRSHAE